jgi:type IV pilus assembly protein PilF
MKKDICLILFLVFLCSCATGIDNAHQASAHYKLGISHYSENNIQMAFLEFQKAYEYNPDDKEVLNAIGIIYLLKFDDYGKAKDFFEKAIKIDKDFSEAYNNLGFAYEKLGKDNEAIDVYKKAVSNLLYRTPEKAYYNLGRLYYKGKRYDEAIEAYNKALKRGIDFYHCYYGLALVYNAKGNYGEASSAITKAIELDPNYKGDRNKAMGELIQKKLKAKDGEEKDIADFMEILKY